jgi:hypothetical protein
MSENEIEIPGVGTLRIEQSRVDVSSAIDGLGYIHREVPGRVAYFLNDEPISEAEYRRLTGR